MAGQRHFAPRSGWMACFGLSRLGPAVRPQSLSVVRWKRLS
ncbi:unnamed protein product [Acidocella sp. C78]|nr:unnamed protein product [Acidocella sp. C78]